MKLKNSIYYVPYQILEKKNISFADFSKKKNYYNQLAFLFEDASSRKQHTNKEADFIVDIARKYLKCFPSNSFLDLPCGAGRHDRILSRKGFDVTGIDASDSLLRIARKHDKKTIYKKSDFRTFSLRNKKFDCIFSLWDSYVYLSQPKDINSFIKNCYKHLKPGGILILDSKNFWKKDNKDRLEQKKLSLGDYNCLWIARRNTVLKDRVHEGIFSFFLMHKTKNQYYTIIDQELTRIYSPQQLKKICGKRFELIETLGDFSLKEKYKKLSSSRLIMVFLRK